MDQKKVGLFLKKLRKEKDITQEKFAEQLNVSSRTISRWETGNNLPDISLLVTIADFYKVDVREIIEGERKSEMDEEIKDVANKMADYAGNEKSKLMNWIKVIGFVGVIIMTIAIVFQCVAYEPTFLHNGALITSCTALIIMVVITLYVVGILEKISKPKNMLSIIKYVTIILMVISLCFVTKVLFVVGLFAVDFTIPYKQAEGIKNYNKEHLLKEYSGDLNSGFFIFPDSVNDTIDTNYNFNIKTNLFDSDGSIILDVKYNKATFQKELKRLANITCELKYDGKKYTNKIKYNEDMYKYPAYISSDGFDYVYEYALIDKENQRIIYINLSYPNYNKLKKYKDFLKRDANEYENDEENTLNNFTIYAKEISEEYGYIEYSDIANN